MLHLRLAASRVFIPLLALFVAPVAVNAQLVTAPGAGVSPLVRVIDTNGTERTFFAYHQAFTGGVRIALGDVTGDGVLDIVTAPGPGGGPHVRVWNGVDLTEVGGFFAYDPAFPGGVFVAAGDVDGDGRADIITSAGAGGGPHVRIWSGADFHELGGFFAYHPAFPGGVTVAAGDVNGDGRADIVTGPGPGGGPHVRIWNGADLNEIFGFFAYDPGFPGGVTVAAGDVNGDGRADVITGAGPGGGPHVRVWNINGFAELGGFFAYDPAFTGGINVAALDLTGDGRTEIITGVGPGGLPISSIWSGTDLSLMGSYFAFDPSFRAGVFVASVGKSSPLRFTSATSTAFSRGAAGTFTVTTGGGAGAPALSVTGALPAGVTFVDNGNRTATLSGTPTVSGSFPLTFTADNGSSAPITQSFTLTVNEAPAIASASSVTFSVGSAASTFTVTTTGSPTPDLAASGTLPSGITFTDNDDGTATLAGTPASGSSGTYPLVITASNSSGAAVQNFTLTINAAAAITSVNATTFTAGAAGSFTVTTTGSPTATIAVSGALPSGVTFVNNGNGTATLSGAPGAATGGAYLLTITATNGVGAAATQSFTLTVNQAPAVTSATNATFAIGQAGSFTVTSTGFPVPGLVAGGAALPGGVTFVDNSNGTGTLSGTPAAGTAGSYALTFTASNVVGSSPVQSFTLTVACPAISVTPAPGALAPGTFGQAYSQTLGATGSSGVTFAITAGALPPGLTLATSGLLSGSPANTGTFNFTVTATDAFSCTGSASYSIAVSPNAVNESYNGGVGNTQLIVSLAPFSPTPAVIIVGTVLDNDAGPGPFTAGPAGIPSANGGTVAMGAGGAFVYTPAIGFAGPSDTFVYTLTDVNGITDTATVTVNLSGRLWYVNNSGANGDGRSHSPFNALSNAQAPSGTGDVIFVHEGIGPTPGAIALKTDQTLWGNAHGFALNSLSISPAGAPVLAGPVTLANGVLVRAVNISSGAAAAIVGTALTGTETIESVNIVGGATGYNLTNVNGTVNISNGSISGVGGTDVRIIGGNAAIAVGSPITNTSGRSVDIENRTGGSVGFLAPISDTDQGILLSNNSGGTVLFLGGLTLNTGGNAAFTATNGGGRVSAQQDNISIVNTITTTTGTALNVTNYGIGSVGLTFRSISANGAASGIVLENTGTGPFTVTGTGTAGSGGTLNASAGPGLVLTGTGPVSLSHMNIQNGGDDGIRGSGVNGFTLANVNVTNNGNAVGEHGIDMAELTGSGGMTSVTVSGSAERNVRIANTTGILSSFAVTGSTFANTSMTTGDDGFLVEQNGTGAMTLSVTGSTFTDNRGDHFQVASNADAAGSIAFNFSNNTLSTTTNNDPMVVGGGITISPSGSTAVTFTIDGNDIQQAFDDAINLNLGTAATSAAALVGTISNNTIGTAGDPDSGSESSNAITVTSNGAGVTTVAILNNQVVQYANAYGIFLNNKEGSSTLNATVTGNTVSNPGTFALNGIRVDAGATAGPPADNGVACVAISGNSVATSGLLADDIRLRQRFNTTIRLPGYAGGNSDTTAVNAFVQGNNGGAGTDVSSSHNVGGGGFGFIGGGGCIQP